MSDIYLADCDCKVSASEALEAIDKQYLGWGWNTEERDYQPQEITLIFEPRNNDELACMNAVNDLLGNHLSLEGKIRVLNWNLEYFKQKLKEKGE